MKTQILESTDTRVKKFVFTTKNAVAEAVLYKYPEYKDRTVICCSVQSGCAVGCTFCGTGKQFIRQLNHEEIIFQVKACLDTIDCKVEEIGKLQIMFMSMGEPFHNYWAVKKAILELNRLYPNAALLISTSAPSQVNIRIKDFLNLASIIDKIGLQISVHESTDDKRKILIPTPTSTLEEIGKLGEQFLIETGRQPFFNYCAHDKNTTEEDINNLLKNFDPDVWQCTISVICECDESVHQSKERQHDLINSFSQRMLEAGYSIRIFDPAGQDDIGGGCGQLWATQKWLKEHNEK